MAVTNYYTVNGQIRGEASSGVRTNYLPDAAGSVTATVNESGSIVNTYRYKPYGAQLSKSGAGADPKFLWLGELGYRQDSSGGGNVYVRARNYLSELGRWTSIDKLWPLMKAYEYVNSNPITWGDPSGLAACKARCCCDIKSAKLEMGKIWTGPYWGHSLALLIEYDCRNVREGDFDDGCDLTWWEKSKVSKSPVPIDQWYDTDDYYRNPFVDSPKRKFREHQIANKCSTDCPNKTHTFVYTDKPGVEFIPPGGIKPPYHQVLCISILIRSGCKHTWYFLSFIQVNWFVNGKLFKQSPPDPLSHSDRKYCVFNFDIDT